MHPCASVLLPSRCVTLKRGRRKRIEEGNSEYGNSLLFVFAFLVCAVASVSSFPTYEMGDTCCFVYWSYAHVSVSHSLSLFRSLSLEEPVEG